MAFYDDGHPIGGYGVQPNTSMTKADIISKLGGGDSGSVKPANIRLQTSLGINSILSKSMQFDSGFTGDNIIVRGDFGSIPSGFWLLKNQIALATYNDGGELKRYTIDDVSLRVEDTYGEGYEYTNLGIEFFKWQNDYDEDDDYIPAVRIAIYFPDSLYDYDKVFRVAIMCVEPGVIF